MPVNRGEVTGVAQAPSEEAVYHETDGRWRQNNVFEGEYRV